MEPFAVVKGLNVIEGIRNRFISRGVACSVNPFVLEAVEPALRGFIAQRPC
jgi:hypothetical protein